MKNEPKNPPECLDDLFEHWRSTAHLADDLGVKYSRARTMKSRQAIPVQYWESIIRIARLRGIKGVTPASLLKWNQNWKRT